MGVLQLTLLSIYILIFFRSISTEKFWNSKKIIASGVCIVEVKTIIQPRGNRQTDILTYQNIKTGKYIKFV